MVCLNISSAQIYMPIVLATTCSLISYFVGQLEMVQQGIDTKFGEYNLGDSKMDLPNGDKQLVVAVKKTPLRDLQNDNKNMVPTSV
jgi:hypothetical protein